MTGSGWWQEVAAHIRHVVTNDVAGCIVPQQQNLAVFMNHPTIEGLNE